MKGIEPNKNLNLCVAKEFKLDIFCGTFEDFLKNNKERYSVVNLSGVIEHIHNPTKMLIEINSKLLYPKGIICIEVPNDFNVLQELISVKNNKWWVCPDHINYFNKESLNKLLINSGYKTFYSTVTFPLELFILMGDNYLKNPDIGSEVHNKRVILENYLNTKKGLIIKQSLYTKFLEIGIGRTLIVYAKKDDNISIKR